jgi:hypothetical protein
VGKKQGVGLGVKRDLVTDQPTMRATYVVQEGSAEALQSEGGGSVPTRRHIMKNLKKVARLPGKDRREVLKILSREVRKRSGKGSSDKSVEVVRQGRSQSDSTTVSVNKDW